LNQYIQLGPEGKFFIKKTDGLENGTYGIKNGAIAFLTKEKVILGRIEKNKIILESGTLWRKK